MPPISLCGTSSVTGTWKRPSSRPSTTRSRARPTRLAKQTLWFCCAITLITAAPLHALCHRRDLEQTARHRRFHHDRRLSRPEAYARADTEAEEQMDLAIRNHHRGSQYPRRNEPAALHQVLDVVIHAPEPEQLDPRGGVDHSDMITGSGPAGRFLAGSLASGDRRPCRRHRHRGRHHPLGGTGRRHRLRQGIRHGWKKRSASWPRNSTASTANWPTRDF